MCLRRSCREDGEKVPHFLVRHVGAADSALHLFTEDFRLTLAQEENSGLHARLSHA